MLLEDLDLLIFSCCCVSSHKYSDPSQEELQILGKVSKFVRKCQLVGSNYKIGQGNNAEPTNACTRHPSLV